MKSRRKYDEEFKRDAVNLLASSKKTLSQVASRPWNNIQHAVTLEKGISDSEKQPFTGNGKTRDEEMARLRKELAETKLERDILKKAVAIFSVHEK